MSSDEKKATQLQCIVDLHTLCNYMLPEGRYNIQDHGFKACLPII